MIVIPTVLEKEFLKAEERIIQVKDTTNWIQIDVIDGFFGEGKSFELELMSKIKNIENKLLDVHLMVKNPIKWVNKCVFIGASRIIGQVEMMEDVNEFIKTVKNEGIEAGMAFDIDTPISDEISDEVDEILLMSRKAGFGEYKFGKKVWEKIRGLIDYRLKKGLNFLIGVDGGIGTDGIKRLGEIGVDVVYSGNNYFKLIDVN